MATIKNSLIISIILFQFSTFALAMHDDKTYMQILDNSVQYEHGHVGVRVKSSGPTPHSSQALDSESYDDVYESIVNKIDGRTEVGDTTLNPYRIHGHLITTFSNGKTGYGSGTIVGDHHVLTAGHNVFNKKNGWAASIKFIPARVGEISPFGEASGARVYTFRKWVDARSTCYDMALVTLNNSIGKTTGRAELMLTEHTSTLVGENIEISGYPGDKNPHKDPNGWRMWTMSGQVMEMGCHRIFYNIDSFKGQSGSGILINHGNHYCLTGVHIKGEEAGNKMNSGVYLSSGKIDLITEWIAQTKNILSSSQAVLPQSIYYVPSKTNSITETDEELSVALAEAELAVTRIKEKQQAKLVGKKSS